MRIFRDLFEEDEELQQIVDLAMKYPKYIQGVSLELHPYWVQYLKLRKAFGQSNNLNLNDFIYHLLNPGYNWCTGNPFITIASSSTIDRITLDDIKSDKWWKFLCEEASRHYRFYFNPKELPIVVKICLYQTIETAELPRFESNRYTIIYETRSKAVLATSPKDTHRPILGGISIGMNTKNFGTLGGILTEVGSGKKFGLTCAHVVMDGTPDVYQPSQADSSTYDIVGKVKHKTTLKDCLKTDPCSRFGTKLNDCDFALIELDDTFIANNEILNIGPIDRIESQGALLPEDKVEFEGRTSDLQKAELAGFDIFYRFEIKGKLYCYKYVYELIKRGYWPKALGSSVVKEGDSGSWVCIDSGTEKLFCGIVVAKDEERGYAFSTDAAVNWWKSLSMDLDVSY